MHYPVSPPLSAESGDQTVTGTLPLQSHPPPPGNRAGVLKTQKLSTSDSLLKPRYYHSKRWQKPTASNSSHCMMDGKEWLHTEGMDAIFQQLAQCQSLLPFRSVSFTLSWISPELYTCGKAVFMANWVNLESCKTDCAGLKALTANCVWPQNDPGHSRLWGEHMWHVCGRLLKYMSMSHRW